VRRLGSASTAIVSPSLHDALPILHRRVVSQIKNNIFTRKKYLNVDVDSYVAISRSISKALTDYGVEPAKVKTIPSAVGKPKSTLDRKSTRLNSSHVKTAYAVSCLK